MHDLVLLCALCTLRINWVVVAASVILFIYAIADVIVLGSNHGNYNGELKVYLILQCIASLLYPFLAAAILKFAFNKVRSDFLSSDNWLRAIVRCFCPPE